MRHRGLRNSKSKIKGMAHSYVADVAREFAMEFYAAACRKDPSLPSSDYSARLFAEHSWPLFHREARTTLAGMLGSNLDEGLKSIIYDALILDASIPRAGGGIQLNRDF